MKYQLIPSLIARSQQELDERYARVHLLKPSRVQLDIMDGEFVPHTSLFFDAHFPSKVPLEAHLMVKNPSSWIASYLSQVQSVILHYESSAHLHALIQEIHAKKKKVGIALKPETDIDAIQQYIPHIDKVVIMTVQPGAYGARFLPAMIDKIRAFHTRFPRMQVQVDGGINPQNLARCKEAGAHEFVVGSYLQKARQRTQAWKKLQHALTA